MIERPWAGGAPSIAISATTWISTPDYLDWRSDNTVFDQIAAQQDGLVTLSTSGEPVSLRVARVTVHYFDVFGVKAFLGRTFADDEDQPGKDRVAVLSHALCDVNHSQGVMNVRSMESIKSSSLSVGKLQALLLGIFSAISLVLAALGIYGLISYSVAQRTREMGIRSALGASAFEILQLVFRQGLLLTAIGLAIGFAGALGLTRLLAAILYNVDALDPNTLAATGAILLAVSFIACLVPAVRATKVDPTLALRGDS